MKNAPTDSKPSPPQDTPSTGDTRSDRPTDQTAKVPALISARKLNELLKARPADLQLIDTRSSFRSQSNAVADATRLQWLDFSETIEDIKGLLVDTETLKRKLREYNLSPDKWTIVFGHGAEGWGEEGRILWMLEIAGFRQLSYVDGGYRAIAGNVDRPVASPARSDITATKDPIGSDLRFNYRLLSQHLAAIDFLDVRTADEYEGDTPYGSPRGGHIPGASHLWLRDFFNSDGFVLSGDQLIKKLADVGITGKKTVVAYCTGGVRSALAAYIIRHQLGYRSSYNYDGSWWEWSRKVRP